MSVIAVMGVLFAMAMVGARPAALPNALVAVNRCNSQTVDDAYARILDLDRRGSGGTPAQLLQRYAELSDVMGTLRDEREVLENLCATDTARAPLFAEIAAAAAWGLTLDSDIAARLNESCAAAATGLPSMMLADAWLAMATVVNDDGGTVPKAFNDVIPRVRTRAAAIGLDLPGWSRTSEYWRDQVHSKARAAAATCPTPTPIPTP